MGKHRARKAIRPVAFVAAKAATRSLETSRSGLGPLHPWAASRETFILWPFTFAMAIRPVIFLPKRVGEWDEAAQEAVIAHERVHHRQQRRLGLLRFALAYYLSRGCRWRIERAGYRREFAVYVKRGRRPDVQWYARLFSGSFYARMIGYSDARAWCTQTLERLEAL